MNNKNSDEYFEEWIQEQTEGAPKDQMYHRLDMKISFRKGYQSAKEESCACPACGTEWELEAPQRCHSQILNEKVKSDQKIADLESLIAKTGEALRAGIVNQQSLIAECTYHREEKGHYSDAFRLVHDETTLKLLREQREALTTLTEHKEKYK